MIVHILCFLHPAVVCSFLHLIISFRAGRREANFETKYSGLISCKALTKAFSHKKFDLLSEFLGVLVPISPSSLSSESL